MDFSYLIINDDVGTVERLIKCVLRDYHPCFIHIYLNNETTISITSWIFAIMELR